jgi:lactobin A/cerein 7B family class IIb bacteriocin
MKELKQEELMSIDGGFVINPALLPLVVFVPVAKPVGAAATLRP